MKRILLLAVLSSAITAYGQGWAIGARVGDPAGITFKKYFNRSALEVSVGSAKMLYNSKLAYRGLYDFYINQTLGYSGFETTVNEATVPMGGQINILFNKDISYTVPALQWYHGFGGQFRIQKASYDFRYKLPDDPNWHYVTGEKVTDVDLGANAIIGIEFRPASIPVSLFVDANLFMEFVDDPFVLWLQAGAGLRINFGGGPGASKSIPTRG